MTHPAASPRPWRPAKTGLMLAVRVTPKAGREGIDGVADTAEGPAVKVRVRAVPADGEANAAVAATVARWLGLPAGRVAVAKGHKSRVKMLTIVGTPDVLEALLTERMAALG